MGCFCIFFVHVHVDGANSPNSPCILDQNLAMEGIRIRVYWEDVYQEEEEEVFSFWEDLIEIKNKKIQIGFVLKAAA